ncbi:hypothetical protein HHL23_09385 [Chryseobacterium sp. RP-3-3]|uniref:Uncharacterized protein n=1 Tax=Chryseobacterium antibioticum TaxID=2728847 RepID=A0A7Y0AMC9_9FLAO|nr:hypothetical protein [Chryseobacterium antibioticum]NML70012.1 hypothetical protein [Chryseobacterium antibioticum]
MKQIELELKERLLIVGFENLAALEFFKYQYYYDLSHEYTKDKYGLICKGSEFTDEVAEEFVLKIPGCKMTYYLHNNEESNITSKALDSFKSAIEAQGYYWGENPFNERINAGYTYEKWQEAESRTFNPEKSIICKILKS